MKVLDRVLSDIAQMREDGPKINLFNPNVMLTHLIFFYQVIQASEQLLEEAAALATGRLKQYYLSHVEEERGHAKWLADDLKCLGVDVEKVTPMRLAAALVGSQYYLIKHRDPACLLGYMAVLEGFPIPMEAMNDLEETYGEKPMRCFKFHAVHDQEHRKELFDVIREVNKHCIWDTAVMTQGYLDEYSNMVNRNANG